MNTAQKLTALRQKMDKAGAAAVIVPSGDPHQSEYTAAHWQARHWLTGFTGSAGTAVITQTRAILWTDFRYWIQAESQMDEFELFKQGENDVPDFDKWLTKELAKGETIALDGKMVPAAQAKKMRTRFESCDLVFDTSRDLISDLWENRPPMPATQAFVLEPVYAGETRAEKLGRIRNKMTEFRADVHLMTALDDIAWTFNLRGEDVHTNPVNLAFALIGKESVTLFINPDKLSKDVKAQLEADSIGLEPYDDIDKALKGLGQKTAVLLSPEAVSDHFFRLVDAQAKIIEKPNPASRMKCIKNEVEIKHIKETAVKDGRAVVSFLHWLETGTEPKTEISVADKILSFRKEQDDFISPSFDSIMAFKANSAMCHYSATPETDEVLDPDAMFLTDSGGNYLTGTTDITRTLHLGNPGEKEAKDYTLVLKGHIAVATAKFPSGTRGYQVDTLARQFLWNQGMDFGHGTGHGVGFFLCVHEGPARISPHPVDEALKPGMLLTNEPGLYREGEYGIRLENMVLVAEDEKNEFGQFLRFENMTLCHFERDLLDKRLLTDQEIEWIDNYHSLVFEKLAPGLNDDVKDWLKAKTQKL